MFELSLLAFSFGGLMWSLGAVFLAFLCLVLMGLGLVSIHAERAFAPDGEFARTRFGMPLFWSGHVQLAAALLILLCTQAANWLFGDSLRDTWQFTLIAKELVM